MNAQRISFYAPAKLVLDAREHGVEVRPVSANDLDWDFTLEPRDEGSLALRLGFQKFKPMCEAVAEWDGAARDRDYPVS